MKRTSSPFHIYAPQEIVIATLPPGESHWLEQNLIARVRACYDVPITHVVSRYGLDAG